MAIPAFIMPTVALFVTRKKNLSNLNTPRSRNSHWHVPSMRQKLDASGIEYITLESFMKVQGISGTGGQAKIMIAEGNVTVNSQAETRRGRKLRDGDVVFVDGQNFRVEFTK